jgi:AraC-like DNA-binding protein
MVLHDESFVRLVRARDAIHSRYGEPLSLDQLAREAALSPFHFLRLFRRAFGETPHQYLTRVRIEAAKRLLLDDVPVTDVCFEVGFQSLGSFSSLFHKYVGHAPITYRERAQAKRQIPGCFLVMYNLESC